MDLGTSNMSWFYNDTTEEEKKTTLIGHLIKPGRKSN